MPSAAELWEFRQGCSFCVESPVFPFLQATRFHRAAASCGDVKLRCLGSRCSGALRAISSPDPGGRLHRDLRRACLCLTVSRESADAVTAGIPASARIVSIASRACSVSSGAASPLAAKSRGYATSAHRPGRTPRGLARWRCMMPRDGISPGREVAPARQPPLHTRRADRSLIPPDRPRLKPVLSLLPSTRGVRVDQSSRPSASRPSHVFSRSGAVRAPQLQHDVASVSKIARRSPPLALQRTGRLAPLVSNDAMHRAAASRQDVESRVLAAAASTSSATTRPLILSDRDALRGAEPVLPDCEPRRPRACNRRIPTSARDWPIANRTCSVSSMRRCPHPPRGTGRHGALNALLPYPSRPGWTEEKVTLADHAAHVPWKS